MSEQLHSCGYFCDRPECAIAQRDELVLNKTHMEQRIKELEAELSQYKASAPLCEEEHTAAVAKKCAEIVSQFNVDGAETIADEIRKRFGL